jgi:hypothetical protein
MQSWRPGQVCQGRGVVKVLVSKAEGVEEVRTRSTELQHRHHYVPCGNIVIITSIFSFSIMKKKILYLPLDDTCSVIIQAPRLVTSACHHL